MTQTIGASTSTGFRPTTRTLLSAGAAAGPLFLGLGVLQGLTRDGFDFTRNALSQLSLGDLGWLQVTDFLVTGVLVLAGATGLRRALRGRPGGVWAPRLITAFGVSFLTAGVFTADPGKGFPADDPAANGTTLSWPGTLHLLSGTLGYLALVAAFLVLARHFAGRGERGWAIGSRVLPVLVLAGFASSAASMLAFTLGAGAGLLGLTAVSLRLARV
ncbi:DUF998 domain-containing protein [Kitasatospora sp. NPDC058965]|uniref:DUF998 domain-containing protein n=1 Tax=Kitasatospora sp. NPDC058965 TaxID=3346682 RepID=UPI0036973426